MRHGPTSWLRDDRRTRRGSRTHGLCASSHRTAPLRPGYHGPDGPGWYGGSRSGPETARTLSRCPRHRLQRLLRRRFDRRVRPVRLHRLPRKTLHDAGSGTRPARIIPTPTEFIAGGNSLPCLQHLRLLYIQVLESATALETNPSAASSRRTASSLVTPARSWVTAVLTEPFERVSACSAFSRSTPVARQTIRLARSSSFLLVARRSTIRLLYTLPIRIIVAVLSMLRTIFSAVPAFMRVDPMIASGPTRTAMEQSAIRSISESGVQVKAIVVQCSVLA